MSTTRAETAALTRQALLDAAAELLDRGGPDAVTLREVGGGAGVSRSAAYRHFDDKDALLMALATDAWATVAAGVEAIVGDDSLSPTAALRTALEAVSDLGRARPHLYRLMFAQPTTSSAPTVEAAGRAQDGFLVLVGRVVGVERARPFAGVLMAAAHGVTDLDLSGHLPPEKWHADRHQLMDLLVEMIARG
ncbi:TetR/AcrR family transcriptional regulator [Gordonia insulae]|uniref:HTH-type transcriptional regulator BetI n=1 Tax=Gordonia insulae TaxID=2420509 RepID=A0A3G8JNU0_9ACTN|nr:TetR/AcrR family transcriptional regulator [Gordonia insulae]AZG46172.1 HTH-type transcriptional regulator BetI [Gordonia insulae]